MSFWDQLGKFEKLLTIGVCLLTLGTACYKAFSYVVGGGYKKVAIEQTESTTFTGSVMDFQSSSPIGAAAVTIYEDQKTPQTLYTDSSGNFHIAVKTGTATLRLRIAAAGYETFTVDAKVDRIGPEEVRLRKLKSGVVKPARSLPSGSKEQSARAKKSAENIPVEEKQTSKPQEQSPIAPQPASQTFTQQCSTGPCVGQVFGDLNIGGGQIQRRISSSAATAAIATLIDITPKGTVRIDANGSGRDIEPLVSQLIQVFSAGGWRAFRGIHMMGYSRIDDFGADGGEGIHCSGQQSVTSTKIANALRLTGFGCDRSYDPQNTDRLKADFYVMVGNQSP